MARTLIISDTHLGSPRVGSAKSAEALRPLWQGFDRIIFNGDVAEIHDPRYRTEAAKQASRLLELCELDGVEVSLISGNHDPFVSAQRYQLLEGDQLLVTHGDTFHPAVAPWAAEAKLMKAEQQASLEAMPNPGRRIEDQLLAAEHANLQHWMARTDEDTALTVGQVLRQQPLMPFKLLYHWWKYPRLAAAFTRRHTPSARFVVFGHTHRAGIWHINGITVMNTGCYGFPSKPRAVVLNGEGEIAMWPIQFAGEAYRLGRKPIAKYALTPSEAVIQTITPKRRHADYEHQRRAQADAA